MNTEFHGEPLPSAASAELRGMAFGIFRLVSGAALLLASVMAGSLWSVLGTSATFVAGTVFAALAATGQLLYHQHERASAASAGA